jgi:hypothetical protein
MSSLAVFLIAVGIADICARLTGRRWPALLAAPAVVLGCAALAGLWHAGDIGSLIVATAVIWAWVWLAPAAEHDRRHRSAALVVFGTGVAVLIGMSGWSSPVGGLIGRWLPWAGLGEVEPGRAVMIAGVVLLQLATGNQLVRLVLTAVGAVRPSGEPQPSDRLKGGRLLGPMERLLIVGLGLGGQLAMASAVVAAKSVIRFPELTAQRRESGDGPGIDEVTEYFLVGSFASWLAALTGLALTH